MGKYHICGEVSGNLRGNEEQNLMGEDMVPTIA